MNTTVELDSSNEGENVNPNIELVKPKIEKGNGEKLGDTIELSSNEEDSDISITEEKKPILKRSTAAFNSTRNDTLPSNLTVTETSLNMQTPYYTPQSSTPAPAYKSIVTSTPAGTPRFTIPEEMLQNETPESGVKNLSVSVDSEDDQNEEEEISSSSTEGADSTKNLSDTDEDKSEYDKKNLTYQSSETIRMGTEESVRLNKSSQDNIDSGLDNSVKVDNASTQETEGQDMDTSINEQADSIDGGGDSINPACKGGCGKIEEEQNSKSFDQEESLVSISGDRRFLCLQEFNHENESVSELINEKHRLDEIDENNLSNNKINKECAKMLEMPTSGEESDIEDDATAKGKIN